ncbi:MAG TPA: DUF1835 domain-containing protein [Clostridiales bacterium]|nr:DUF1835 domain-containing protein [Clostridiales bacterium]
MLEIVFSDSTKGSMKVAKKFNGKDVLGGAIGYIGDEPSEAEFKEFLENSKKHWEGQAVGGSSTDVVYLGFAMDIGDISGEFDNVQRQAVYSKLWDRFGLADKERVWFFQEQRRDMEKLLEAADNGIPIRIWKSNAPYSACGFHFICHVLRNIDCSISVISLPEYKQESENEIVIYNSWMEVDAGKFYQFLPLERQLSRMEKWMYGDRWRDLIAENAPLRAVVNGRLISVPENFYDHIITGNLPEDNFVMGRFIGSLLGNYNLGVSDSWYALRIDQMIDEGKLTVVEDKDTSHPYRKLLSRAKV